MREGCVSDTLDVNTVSLKLPERAKRPQRWWRQAFAATTEHVPPLRISLGAGRLTAASTKVEPGTMNLSPPGTSGAALFSARAA